MPTQPAASKQSSMTDRALERLLAKKAESARSETAARNEAILELHRRGYTLRQIGDLAGLSHTQVGNLVTKKRKAKKVPASA